MFLHLRGDDRAVTSTANVGIRAIRAAHSSPRPNLRAVPGTPTVSDHPKVTQSREMTTHAAAGTLADITWIPATAMTAGPTRQATSMTWATAHDPL
jgi:hypothetical protein